MRKSLLALATLPIAGLALTTLGAGTATAADDRSAGTTVHAMANCSPIGRLSDRAEGTCWDVAFRVGVRCESRGNWQIFFSEWTQPGYHATAYCPATWVAVSADYDLPD
ncbi:hypothetical protein AB0N89_25290 [Amycolatopsis sp. NPDC089917]|uniref:hypothetical protein n=1 Tax=Amycolatopsis sp. NPDC089917 TaxID=3155187 RepID=UPI0034234046